MIADPALIELCAIERAAEVELEVELEILHAYDPDLEVELVFEDLSDPWFAEADDGEPAILGPTEPRRRRPVRIAQALAAAITPAWRLAWRPWRAPRTWQPLP